MKILVTGNKGFIGSNMVSLLKKQKHDVVTYEWGDSLPTIAGLDWVIHMGAISSTTEKNVEKIMMQNYDFSCWLLNECIANGVNFQYSSTAGIYGGNTEFAESSPVNPRTTYAWSKYLFERFADRKAPILIQGFRYFNVYGPGEKHKGDQASPFHKFSQQAKKDGVIKVFKNSHKCLRDFVPVKEVCNTHIKFFDVLESGIWNVGTGNTMSFLDVAKTFNVPIEEIPMPNILKDNYQYYTCADMTKTNNTLEKYNAKSS
jgi:ADP-L-glycero-D-manno-heptose 6-epimerase